jgi:hypothetical protein
VKAEESSWGPVEATAAKNMDMQVIHSLASVFFAVDDKPGAIFLATQCFSQLLRLEEEFSKQGTIGGLNFHDVSDMALGNEEEVYRRLGGYVVKRKRFIVLVDFL